MGIPLYVLVVMIFSIIFIGFIFFQTIRANKERKTRIFAMTLPQSIMDEWLNEDYKLLAEKISEAMMGGGDVVAIISRDRLVADSSHSKSDIEKAKGFVLSIAQGYTKERA